ncbi:CGNR zinc finger domain-containing protein [Pseudonocardia kunmingensis]|uniref:Putative RNA-binding Zn ribbon-like protein n=1 Tax=Pseudonocardia kunmingensis TaxID=630975 RepID=A0A543DYI6_9PSEU|nr:ABATE domain-containing protein [Pseudonocardia kunmingensis]TQM14391.1 putative RNA-binding Zn ribbon-like protein [Pseudonocardia kunmingensis]
MTIDPAHPAPGRLALVQRFANTDDRYNGHDELADPGQAAGWLVAHGLLAPYRRITAAELAALHELRDAVRELAASNGAGGGPPAPNVLAAFNRVSAAGPQVVEIGTDDHGRPAAVSTPHDSGFAAVVARLTGAVHEAVLTGAWPRLKACADPSCAWLFYDTSRSRTGRWCSMGACGSINKARNYRRRSRDRAAIDGPLS